MKIIYIAGAYRSPTAWQTQQNIRDAEATAATVWELGLAALCPHTNSAHMEGVTSEETFLAGTLEMMRRCDAILLVPNWKQSRGTLAEIEEAKRLSKPIFYSFTRFKLWISELKHLEKELHATLI